MSRRGQSVPRIPSGRFACAPMAGLLTDRTMREFPRSRCPSGTMLNAPICSSLPGCSRGLRPPDAPAACPPLRSLALGLVRSGAFRALPFQGPDRGDRIGVLRSLNDNLPGRVLAFGCGPHHPARFSLTALPLVEGAVKASIAILPGIPTGAFTSLGPTP